MFWDHDEFVYGSDSEMNSQSSPATNHYNLQMINVAIRRVDALLAESIAQLQRDVNCDDTSGHEQPEAKRQRSAEVNEQ